MKITLVGGDARQVWLARLFNEDGHQVAACALGDTGFAAGTEAIAEAEAVILPLPALDAEGYINTPLEYEKIRPEEVLRHVRKDAAVFAGKLRAEGVIDYFEREELTLINADITAEGAVQLLMEEHPLALRDMDVLVAGAGRIGTLLAGKLRALGAKVAVSARRESDLAKIALMGCESVRSEELPDAVKGRDAVVNTVPDRILRRGALENMKKDVILIDLASRPGGFSMGEAAELGLRAVKAASLPGKCAPKSSAAAIRDTIYNIMRERKCEIG